MWNADRCDKFPHPVDLLNRSRPAPESFARETLESGLGYVEGPLELAILLWTRSFPCPPSPTARLRALVVMLSFEKWRRSSKMMNGRFVVDGRA